MDCSNVQIKYKGNGSQIPWTFPFEYMDETDIWVGLWNNETIRWDEVPAWLNLNEQPSVVAEYYWTFENPTTIKFLKNTNYDASNPQLPVGGPVDWAPPAPELPNNEPDEANIIIQRRSDDNDLVEFYPGSSIRAQDLNYNFEDLLYLIQEGRCKVSDAVYDYLRENFWSKLTSETTYSVDDWDSEADDLHIPTTGAVDKHIDETIEGKIVTRQQQENGLWIKDGNLDTDEYIPSTSATSERHDPFFQDSTPSPTPAYRTPGRRWFDSDDILDKIWDQSVGTWVNVVKAGPIGPTGPEGTYSTIMSETPPTQRNNGDALEDGDLWFSTQIGELFIWYNDGTSTQWVNVVSSVPGPPGQNGQNGQDGQDGQNGQDGQDGAAATIEVGTTTTGAPGTNAAVSNSGTTSAAVFDFVIPRGDQGDQGDRGDPGNQGQIGDNPPANPDVGDLWFDTKCPSGQYIWDGNQWVGTSIPGPAGPAGGVTSIIAGTNITIDPPGGTGTVTINSTATGGGGIPEAPNDGELYGRQSQAWAAINIPDPGIPEAPNDGQQYARQSQAWSVVAAPNNLNFIAPLQQTGDNVSFVWNSINALP